MNYTLDTLREGHRHLKSAWKKSARTTMYVIEHERGKTREYHRKCIYIYYTAVLYQIEKKVNLYSCNTRTHVDFSPEHVIRV